jgi:Fe-S cluster assembly iron-binding protein IscA
MVKITETAANKLQEIFDVTGFEEPVAIRLGMRPGKQGTEQFFEFVAASSVNPLGEVILYTNGIQVFVDRNNEHRYKKLVIDYLDSPEGFIFESEGG